ncbi:putative phosphatase-domain-containing protein [Suillus cothurnatus]|nr:putative phosphatase-domain-containing protein [Suillus cothurnatus]
MATIKTQLVVFDFDWSMADQDTDRWIFEVLAPDIRRKIKTLKESVQWTDLIAQSLQEIHARGRTREEIEHTLRQMPFVTPAMVRGVTNLKGGSNPTTTFFCLSNANSVFINTILESKGLQNLFEEIVTNPAEFEPSGLLKLRRRVDPNGPQHSCTVGCSPNMCKGEELAAFLERHKPGYDRHLDMVLCRRFRGLEGRISREGGHQCQVKYWAGAWEVEEIFNQFIEKN